VTLLHAEELVNALRALTGNQAMQRLRAGVKATCPGGWQVAGPRPAGRDDRIGAVMTMRDGSPRPHAAPARPHAAMPRSRVVRHCAQRPASYTGVPST
jgi:hypothetical protein